MDLCEGVFQVITHAFWSNHYNKSCLKEQTSPPPQRERLLNLPLFNLVWCKYKQWLGEVCLWKMWFRLHHAEVMILIEFPARPICFYLQLETWRSDTPKEDFTSLHEIWMSQIFRTGAGSVCWLVAASREMQLYSQFKLVCKWNNITVNMSVKKIRELRC